MKKSSLFLALILIGIFVSSAQQHKKVLFLGNSYTQYNNMANIVSNVALSLGDTLTYDSNTPGGYTFEGHSTNATSLSKIAANNWDFVVLQEQSQRPSFSPNQVERDVYPFADSLVQKIYSNDSCTQVIFYMTWGRKNGDASNCQFYTPICTYEGMQQRLRESYLEMGQQHDASVAPIGMVWKAVRDSFPSIELYNADESHPNLHGSYLVACTFYTSMYHKSCVGAYIPNGITAGDALAIQQTTDRIVFDSLSIWNIDTTTLTAQIEITSQDSTVVAFNSNSTADSYYWDFGDGNTSTAQAPTHSYDTDTFTVYQVSLTTYKSCNSVSEHLMLNIVVDSMTTHTTDLHSTDIGFMVFPNPATESLYISIGVVNKGIITIFDLSGKQLICIPAAKYLDVSELKKGTYIIQYQQNEQTQTSRFIKL